MKTTKDRGRLALNALLIAVVLLISCALPTGEGVKVLISKQHTLLAPTAAGRAPLYREKKLILDNQPGELIWLTGIKTRVESENSASLPSGLISLSELSVVRPHRHLELIKSDQPITGVLFRMSAGISEVQLPKGFGLPLFSNEPCHLVSQSQSVDGLSLPASFKLVSDLDFIRDRGLDKPMKPLFCGKAVSIVSSDRSPKYFGELNGSVETHGMGTADAQLATDQLFADTYGQKFGDYWLLTPGRQKTHTLVTHMLNLQFDTTLHHATGHMLAYGSSVELRDITDGRSLVKLEAVKDRDSGQIDKIEPFSSLEGVPMPKDHHYEIVSVYENTSAVKQPASASMLLYLRDQVRDPEKKR